jgi:hypothetical protein
MAEATNPRVLRRWLLQIALLTALSLAVFWFFYSVDYLATPVRGETGGPLGRYLRFDPERITDAVGSLSGFVAAIFGIVVTVVSIIVQLSASRYAGVTRMFLRDRLSAAVVTFYIVACAFGVWLSPSLQGNFAPHTAVAAMLMMSTLGLVLMVPYFGYVFWFLEPMNIIERIRSQASEHARKGSMQSQEQACFDAQFATLSAMEELTDITSNSISGKDKIIASGAVDALKDFALQYMKRKGEANPRWFSIGPGIKENPDFVAMAPESLLELEERKTWVEWKVMRQYLGIYNEALPQMRDINYLVAIDTRYIGEAAAQARDEELILLVYRYMNSYMRATLNARDVRTAYNVLNQYRLLVESMLKSGNGKSALQGVRHMKYYAHVSYDNKLTFVTETVAYDMSTLCEVAHGQGAPEEEQILKEFLGLDRPLLVQSQEKGLLGVRKAQVKLACYYLARGDEQKARLIARDMQEEPKERLTIIRQELEQVVTKDFWEIIDRGRNFEFMASEQRAQMSVFFGWLGVQSEESRFTTPPVSAP